MRLMNLKVSNYRSLSDLDLDIDDYTALVGTNGAGKSSVLYALDWFFKGYDLETSDLSQRDGSPLRSDIHVTATFGELTSRDRDLLREYGRGETAIFRRSCTPGERGSKVVGRALQGPGFSEFHQADGVSAMRAAYRELADRHPDLERLTGSFSKRDAESALAAWESIPENRRLLVPVDDVDANHMFGINGANVIRDCIQLVLVPAATNMREEFRDGSKSSALSGLLGAIVKGAGEKARESWLEEHKQAVSKLNSDVLAAVSASVASKSQKITNHLRKTIPGAKVLFTPEVPDWKPSSDTVITTSVTVDGVTNDIARQGHGVQRSILIALFQSLVDSGPTVSPQELSEARDGAEPNEHQGPALIIAIEEPEIYQHPVRARAFGRVLGELSDQEGTQVLIATHSPYFISPDRFSSIRRMRTLDGFSSPSSTSEDEVVRRASVPHDRVRRAVQKQLPTSFSEGFFADAVVAVEGDTDRAVIEVLAQRLGTPLDERGISVLELGGKENLRIPYEILTALDIPTYIVADGDADGASRTGVKPGEDLETRQRQVTESQRKSTEKLVSWLPGTNARSGTVPYAFGAESAICDDFTIWRDDLESELANWPSFVRALTAAGGKLRQKHAIAYRQAALDANMSDQPEALKDLIKALVDFGS